MYTDKDKDESFKEAKAKKKGYGRDCSYRQWRQGELVQWRNNSRDEDFLRWSSALYIPLLILLMSFHILYTFLYLLHLLFVIDLLPLYWDRALPIIECALIETFTFYCCYFILECSNVISVRHICCNSYPHACNRKKKAWYDP